MGIYVEVAVNLPSISDTYHYHLSPELAAQVKPGSLVIVPFGRQRVQGVVLRFIDTPEVAETRPVEELMDEKPALTLEQLTLVPWLAEATLSSLGDCINLMLPAGLSQRADNLVSLNPDIKIDEASLSPVEKRMIKLLQKRGDLRGRQIDAAMQHVTWRGTLRKLARAGFVRTQMVLPSPRVRPKTTRKVTLAIEPAAVASFDAPLSRVHRVHDRRLQILQMLAQESEPVLPI